MIGKRHILAITNNRLRRLATYASMAVATILIAIKLSAYLMTDSVAMLTSLFDSTFDLLASVITAYGVASALQPPDANHRYGHGKAEPLAALAQAIFILGSSFILVYEAISRFYRPHRIAHSEVAYAVMSLAIILTISLIIFQHQVVKKTGSSAVSADRIHYASDLAVNLAVVAAFVLQGLTGLTWFDPIFAIAIAIGLFISALSILRYSLEVLMDAELPDAEREKIAAIIKRQSGVLGVHDMRTRSDGEKIFIDCHVEMDGMMPLRKAHELSEEIQAAVMREMPNANVLVHQDPAGLHEETLDAQIAKQEKK